MKAQHSDYWTHIEDVEMPTLREDYSAAIERRWGEYWVIVGTRNAYANLDLRTSGDYHGPYPSLAAARLAVPRIRAERQAFLGSITP